MKDPIHVSKEGSKFRSPERVDAISKNSIRIKQHEWWNRRRVVKVNQRGDDAVAQEAQDNESDEERNTHFTPRKSNRVIVEPVTYQDS
ncbi:hypothetical protein NDU88_000866 [Pleurodeles waltl]|uniref:Uncharacterized protein n=1 Tax=Pleurodeles waltl TaxID=8319 RepID=A0AAV7U679_PLEWA|nr:hypothetical protein NDU88_000866 [Pleurodeles waltl]